MCEQDTEHYAGLPGMLLWTVLQLQWVVRQLESQSLPQMINAQKPWFGRVFTHFWDQKPWAVWKILGGMGFYPTNDVWTLEHLGTSWNILEPRKLSFKNIGRGAATLPFDWMRTRHEARKWGSSDPTQMDRNGKPREAMINRSKCSKWVVVHQCSSSILGFVTGSFACWLQGLVHFLRDKWDESSNFNGRLDVASLLWFYHIWQLSILEGCWVHSIFFTLILAGSTGVVKSACSAAKSVLISRLDERGFFEFTSKKAQHVLILLRHQIVCSDLKLLAGGAWMPDDDATMMHSRNMRKVTIRSICAGCAGLEMEVEDRDFELHYEALGTVWEDSMLGFVTTPQVSELLPLLLAWWSYWPRDAWEIQATLGAYHYRCKSTFVMV